MNTDEALALAGEILEGSVWQLETTRPAPTRISSLLSSADDLAPIVVALRARRLGWLSAITGIDPGVEAGYLEVLYHFTTAAAIITLRVHTPRQAPSVSTLSDLIPCAEVFERELHEMFGVEVVGLRNQDKLYLPDDWPDGVYPLRKDFDPAVLDAHG
jgi:Ni,Fe-hydrogenase III component G